MATKENLFNESIKKSKTATIGDDKGLINSKSETSIVSRAGGSTTINSGIYAQLKCDKTSGVVTEIALQSVVNAVQRELAASDLIINRHKLNTQLLEFTNLKSNMNTIMGDLTVNATILVKTWEPNLEQFVLIRRPARFPVFGHLLDAYQIDERLYLDMEDMFGEDYIELKTKINELEEKKKAEEEAKKEETDTPEEPVEPEVPVEPEAPVKPEAPAPEPEAPKDNTAETKKPSLDDFKDSIKDLLDDFLTNV